MNATGYSRLSSWPLRQSARILAMLWSVFWSVLGFLSGIGEGGGTEAVIAHTIFPGLVFLAAALIAWRWERVGGLLLVLGGFAAIAMFPFATTAGGFPILPLPGLVAGALCWLDWQVRRRAGQGGSPAAGA
jgi:hypothetical protein